MKFLRREHSLLFDIFRALILTALFIVFVVGMRVSGRMAIPKDVPVEVVIYETTEAEAVPSANP